MEAKYGTSYNAYLVTGQKNVLVETVHADFFEEYLYNLQCLVDLPSIDYIVMNHTEPDHSGSLQKLLELCPNSTVVCTGRRSEIPEGHHQPGFPLPGGQARGYAGHRRPVPGICGGPAVALAGFHDDISSGGQRAVFLRFPGVPLLRALHAR